MGKLLAVVLIAGGAWVSGFTYGHYRGMDAAVQAMTDCLQGINCDYEHWPEYKEKFVDRR